jgi:hypothetical protein
MISAKEAQALMPKTPQGHVDDVQPLIEAAAKAGYGSTVIRTDFWANDGYSKTKDWYAACEILKAFGYETKFFYEERQFVDMGTEITWARKETQQ